MKFIISVLVLFTTFPVFAVVEKGDSAPNKCFNTVDDYPICINDFAGYVTVLIYNAGWCGPCNDEFEELVPNVKEFDNKPVVFVSLSVSGWATSKPADKTFLKEWQTKHRITFPVAASPKDAGKDFFKSASAIPATVILDRDGKLVFKGQGVPVGTIFKEVRALVGP